MSPPRWKKKRWTRKHENRVVMKGMGPQTLDQKKKRDFREKGARGKIAERGCTEVSLGRANQ